jgi:hypothetical protein
MKFLVGCMVFIIGFGGGWGLERFHSRRRMNQYVQMFSPEVQEYITQCKKTGAILNAELSKDEIQELSLLAKKSYGHWNSVAYGRAFQSFLMKRMIQLDKKESALYFADSSIEEFLKRYDSGSFKGDANEDVVQRLAEGIRSRSGVIEEEDAECVHSSMVKTEEGAEKVLPCQDKTDVSGLED